MDLHELRSARAVGQIRARQRADGCTGRNLAFAGVVEHILENLKREKFVEVRSQMGGLGEGAYQYAITSAGIVRAREALERSQYAGPAPVPFEEYNQAILRQGRGRTRVTQREMRQALSGITNPYPEGPLSARMLISFCSMVIQPKIFVC